MGPESKPVAAAATLDGTAAGLVELEDALVRRDLHTKMFGRDPGPVMLGRYEVSRRIGAGGMGRVYAGRDRELGREVALKLLTSNASGNRERLRREAQALAMLDDPNIVRVYDIDTVGSDSFIAMELIKGRSMRDWLAETPPAADIAHVLWCIARALADAHRAGVVHRDVKPDNVMIRDALEVKVLDFGLSKREPGAGTSDGVDLTLEGQLLGTPRYMSPEALLGCLADPRADVFSLCVTICEAYGGELPFEGETVAGLLESIRTGPTLPEALPYPLRALVAQGLAFDPDTRPSVAQLADALRRLSFPRTKSLAVTTMLGLFMGFGLGHRYAGERPRANALLAVWLVLVALAAGAAVSGRAWGGALLVALPLALVDTLGATRTVLRGNARAARLVANLGQSLRAFRTIDTAMAAVMWLVFLCIVFLGFVGIVEPMSFQFTAGPSAVEDPSG